MHKIIGALKKHPIEIGIILALLLTSRFFFHYYYDYVKSSSENHHLEYLDHTAMLAHHAIDRQIENLAYYFDGLARVATARGPEDPDLVEVKDDLRAHVRSERSGVVQAGLIGPDGVLIWGAQGNSVLSGLDLRREEHFQASLAPGGQIHVSTPQATARGTRRWLIRFSRQVRNQDGNLLGVAVVSVAVDRLVRQLQTYLLRGEVISVFRNDGALLGTTLANYDDMLGWGLRTSRRPGPTGVFAGPDESVLSGDRRLVVLHAVDTAPLMVSASTPLRGATQEFESVSRVLRIAEVCVGLLILGCGGAAVAIRTRNSARQAFATVQGAREQLARTLDAIDAYVFVAQISSVGNVVEEFSSQGGLRLFRTKRGEELSLQEILETMAPPIGREQRVVIAQELASGRHHVALTSYKLPSGETIWLQLSVAPMEIEHETIHAVGLVVEVDGTQTKAAEVARLQAAATSGLAAELVRDLTQTMTSIALMADNCLGTLDHMPAQQAVPTRERLERIAKIALGTRSVVTRVRQYLQHHARELEAVLLQDILPFALLLANNEVRQRNIHVVNNIPRDLPRVLANKAILEFVFLTIMKKISTSLAYLGANVEQRLEVAASLKNQSDVVEILFSCKVSNAHPAAREMLAVNHNDVSINASAQEFDALELLSKSMWAQFSYTQEDDRCCYVIRLRRAA